VLFAHIASVSCLRLHTSHTSLHFSALLISHTTSTLRTPHTSSHSTALPHPPHPQLHTSHFSHFFTLPTSPQLPTLLTRTSPFLIRSLLSPELDRLTWRERQGGAAGSGESCVRARGTSPEAGSSLADHDSAWTLGSTDKAQGAGVDGAQRWTAWGTDGGRHAHRGGRHRAHG